MFQLVFLMCFSTSLASTSLFATAPLIDNELGHAANFIDRNEEITIINLLTTFQKSEYRGFSRARDRSKYALKHGILSDPYTVKMHFLNENQILGLVDREIESIEKSWFTIRGFSLRSHYHDIMDQYTWNDAYLGAIGFAGLIWIEISKAQHPVPNGVSDNCHDALASYSTLNLVSYGVLAGGSIISGPLRKLLYGNELTGAMHLECLKSLKTKFTPA